MEKEFIPYEQALALKELGFDEPCFATYHKELHAIIPIYAIYTNQDVIKAPLYQQCWRWFREKYGLYSWVTMGLGATLTFCWTITGENKGTEYKAFLKTHEEAELECLKKLIEIVKNDVHRRRSGNTND